MQKKIKIIILVVICLFAFSFMRDFFIKSLIGTVASSVTGSATSVGGLTLSVIKQTIKISDFRMYNPRGFPSDILIDIPKIGVTCDLGALIKGKIHLKELILEIKELGVAKNKEGRLNVDSLKISEVKPAEKKKQKPAKQLAMQIDTMNLAMGRVVSRDYSVAGAPVIKVYDINLQKTYKNIESAQQLAALIISEPLKAAGIQGLKVYAASMLTGAAALPVAAVFTFAGKDFAQASFAVTMDKAFDEGLQLLKKIGSVKRENKASGIISAESNGTDVTLKLKKLDDKTTQITVSARKLGLPQPEVASGVIYQLTDRLK